MTFDLYEIPITKMDGSITTLAEYRGCVLLIVNVASRCGFTSQYAELEALHREYYDRGLRVLGFPCDQFLHQEPGTDTEIHSFATSCFHVTFPLFSKIAVKGIEQAPLYTHLAHAMHSKSWLFIPWNFTKLLVDGHGNVLHRFLPTTSFRSIRKRIEPMLQQI